MELMHIEVCPLCLSLLMQQLSIKHLISFSLSKMLLYFFVYFLIYWVLHLNIALSLLRHFLILLNHFLIWSLGLSYLLSRPSVLVMLHYGLFIEFNMIGCALGPTQLENASPGRA